MPVPLRVNKARLVVVLITLLLLIGLFGQYQTSNKVTPIPNLLTNTKACQTSSSSNPSSFVVFVYQPSVAFNLLRLLCDDKVINKQFGRVEVRWSDLEQDILQNIGKGLADLALVKQNLMLAFATERTHGYQEIALYRDYAAYLISSREKPEISKNYLLGKRIGLLDYPSSRSGHLIPKRMMKELGLNEENTQIVYASTHSELRNLLAAGQVDLISSYWDENDAEQFSENYRSKIEAEVSGTRWYLKMDHQNTDLRCAVQSNLLKLATTSRSNYFNELTIPEPCTGEQQ